MVCTKSLSFELCGPGLFLKCQVSYVVYFCFLNADKNNLLSKLPEHLGALWVLILPGRAKPWAPFDRTWSELSAQPAPDWVATEAYDRSTCRGRTWWTPPGTGSCSLQNIKNVKKDKMSGFAPIPSLGSLPEAGRASGLKRGMLSGPYLSHLPRNHNFLNWIYRIWENKEDVEPSLTNLGAAGKISRLKICPRFKLQHVG